MGERSANVPSSLERDETHVKRAIMLISVYGSFDTMADEGNLFCHLKIKR